MTGLSCPHDGTFPVVLHGKGTMMAAVVAPHSADFGPLDKAHADFHAEQFWQKRRSLHSELRCLSGLPEILNSLHQDTLYKLVLPEGRLLQKGKDGLFRGVFFGERGIEKHARFAAVGPSLLGAAKAVGSQFLLISIAMQLNGIEKMIKSISIGIHRDRIAKLLSGVDQFEHAMLLHGLDHRKHAILNAVQTLQVGLRKTIAGLRTQIAEAPDPGNSIWDHLLIPPWQTKTGEAATLMGLAQESFRAVLLGVRSLTECYAALGEPEAASKTLRDYMGMVEACNIPLAAQKARLVQFSGAVAPQAVWENFANLQATLKEHLELLGPSGLGREQATVEIEFMPSELQGATNAALP
jgi:hypothetical protein